MMTQRDALSEETDALPEVLDGEALEYGTFGFEQDFDGNGEALLDEILGSEAPMADGGVIAAVERQQRRAQGFERAVRGLAPRLQRHGGRLRLAIPQAAIPQVASQLGIPPRGVALLIQSAARARPLPPAQLTREVDFEAGSGCLGVTRFSTEWYGHRLALNSCHTMKVISAAEAGSVAAGICAVVPAFKNQVVCAVIMAVLNLGIYVVKSIHQRGGNRGIVIRKPLLGPPVVWHQ
jgi:hypothetical protein